MEALILAACGNANDCSTGSVVVTWVLLFGAPVAGLLYVLVYRPNAADRSKVVVIAPITLVLAVFVAAGIVTGALRIRTRGLGAPAGVLIAGGIVAMAGTIGWLARPRRSRSSLHHAPPTFVDVHQNTEVRSETTAVPQPNAPAHADNGWRPDPTGRHEDRWFDGTAFSVYVRDGETTDVDPL